MENALFPTFTVYIIAHYDNEDPTPNTETWAVDCEATELGFFGCLKEAITTDGRWEFKGYTVQSSKQVFKNKPARHFASIETFLLNVGGILVSWDSRAK